MQFTRAEAYGMLGIMYLAEKDMDIVTPLSEISEAENIPEKFLSKIFQSLSKAGIVRSHRGVRGGFTLSKTPAELTIKDVLEAIQGPYHLMKCIEDIEVFDKRTFFALKELIAIVEERLISTFEKYTLADLSGWRKGKKIPV